MTNKARENKCTAHRASQDHLPELQTYRIQWRCMDTSYKESKIAFRKSESHTKTCSWGFGCQALGVLLQRQEILASQDNKEVWPPIPTTTYRSLAWIRNSLRWAECERAGHQGQHSKAFEHFQRNGGILPASTWAKSNRSWKTRKEEKTTWRTSDQSRFLTDQTSTSSRRSCLTKPHHEGVRGPRAAIRIQEEQLLFALHSEDGPEASKET